jgi:hypothetical protein
MRTIRKSIGICLILLVLIQGGVMGGVEEKPVSGPAWIAKITAKELNDLERKADRGDIEAIKCLYHYYVFKDSDKAVIWARKGDRLGDVGLSYELGIMLVMSNDSREKAEGITVLEKTANQSHPRAQKELAWCYEYGKGVPKNPLEAERWFRKAAMQGDTIAMVEVVRHLTDRARDISTLTEAYGWTLLALKRTTSKVSQPFRDKINWAQRDILTKAKGFGADERQFISRSKEWARKEDVNIPMTDPWDISERPCKYLHMGP